jgi:hypothetical protein
MLSKNNLGAKMNHVGKLVSSYEGNVYFANETIGGVLESRNGSFTAQNCCLEDVKANNNITLTSCMAKTLEVAVKTTTTGTLSLTGSTISGSVIVRKMQAFYPNIGFEKPGEVNYAMRGCEFKPGVPLIPNLARIVEALSKPGQKFHINGVEITKASDGSYYPLIEMDEIKLEITDGTIKGDIKFINCIGKVKFIGNGVLLGRVIQE